jgi:hypothetical protein
VFQFRTPGRTRSAGALTRDKPVSAFFPLCGPIEGFPLHQPLSYPFVRQPLRRLGPSFLSEIQTAADFLKSKEGYIEVDEREQGP